MSDEAVFFVENNEWDKIESLIKENWRSYSIEEVLRAMTPSLVQENESRLREILRDWLQSQSAEVMTNGTAAFNVVVLLELLALREPDKKLMGILKGFMAHPIKDIAEIAQLAFCQVEDILKIRGYSETDFRAP